MDSSQAQNVVSGPWEILPACGLPVQSMGDQYDQYSISVGLQRVVYPLAIVL